MFFILFAVVAAKNRKQAKSATKPHWDLGRLRFTQKRLSLKGGKISEFIFNFCSIFQKMNGIKASQLFCL